MPVTGVETLVYGVNDIEECVTFFTDFGLTLHDRTEACARFRLDEGSHVELRHIDDPTLPETILQDTGVREVIWGVDTEESLDALVKGLEADRKVLRDNDGTVHFHSDDGLAFGLRVSTRKKVVYSPDPVNAPGHVNRLNVSRKWKTRARPKTINHVVFAVPDFVKSYRFFEERLGFRLTEYQLFCGIYLRCDGANDHHNLFFLDHNIAGAPGYPAFHHTNFGVEDIDEMMVGANYMTRRGWTYGMLGTGRHRISSALFTYFRCPTGGEVEYGTDSDYIDDNYVPREWDALFGLQSWMGMLPDFLKNAEPEWHAKHITKGFPDHIRTKADLPEDGKIA